MNYQKPKNWRGHPMDKAYKAIRQAASLHIRASRLLTMWTSFDPYGAVVYYLRDMEKAAFSIREELIYSIPEDMEIPDLHFQAVPTSRNIKSENSVYGTIKNHLKGISANVRRLEKCLAAFPFKVDYIDFLNEVRDCLSESKAQAGMRV